MESVQGYKKLISCPVLKPLREERQFNACKMQSSDLRPQHFRHQNACFKSCIRVDWFLYLLSSQSWSHLLLRFSIPHQTAIAVILICYCLKCYCELIFPWKEQVIILGIIILFYSYQPRLLPSEYSFSILTKLF